MGYSTDFNGGLHLSTPLTEQQENYINTFASTRRMKRDPEVLQRVYKGEHGFNGTYGVDGEYFAKDDGEYGQSRDESIIEYNSPPSTQPGLWCQWIIEDGQLMHDGGEKFYHYTEWLQYLINNFFSAWQVKLNGQIKWQGEDMEDRGLITVIDNIVTSEELV